MSVPIGGPLRIRLSNADRSFSATADEPVLDAALRAGLNLPHSCKGGHCGSCRARLMQGDVHYLHGRPLGLSDSDLAEGMILLCQARARTDLVVETFEITAADQSTIKRLPARIERTVALSHDVLGMFLRLPAAESFPFEAGQYIDILLPGGRRRSFSIASPPHDARLLELHVRRVPGGEFTEALFSGGPPSALLNIEGPLGQFVYRAAGRGAAPPILMIGGGTGIAPLLSILRHVIESASPDGSGAGIERKITLYWGVRSERDLYAQSMLEALAERYAGLRYAPVLSEPSSAWEGLHGWVHESALRNIDALEGYEVYAAGPPAMIEAIRDTFARRGVAPRRLYFDSFDYAPDALERQRTSAATKS